METSNGATTTSNAPFWRRGLKAIQIWLTPAEHTLLKNAALSERRPMTGLFKRLALNEARRILEKSIESDLYAPRPRPATRSAPVKPRKRKRVKS